MTHPNLMAVLSLQHASEVSDLTLAIGLAATADDDASEAVQGYISQQGRVIAWRAASGDALLLEEAIKVDDDYHWESIGTPRVYRFNTNDEAEMGDDTLRLFMSQSLGNGGVSMSAGWRDRVVALVPEEVGAKESKIIRTLPDGRMEATHTYNVLDAYSKYSEWVNQLANEFGSTDEKLVAGISTPDTAPFGSLIDSIVQSWLMRQAADAALQQARHSLKFGLAAFSRLSNAGAESGSVAELARSLHTDRPNLVRAIKSAEAETELKEVFARLEGMQTGRP